METPQFALWPEDGPKPSTLTCLAKTISTERSNGETPFYIVDLDDIEHKFRLWTEFLPRIRPYYAVKCNANVAILGLLRHLGVGFDCATRNEIDLLLSLGTKPDDIIYAHTVKAPSHLAHARKNRISRLTFDNAAELDKIKEIYPEAELLLRLRVVESDRYKMSDKFGCLPEQVPDLLRKARSLCLNVVGFSFHVGCQSQGPETYREALRLCKQAEQQALCVGYSPKLIDIGGGFNGYRGQELHFRKTAEGIRVESDLLFPPGAGYELLSEPGTFFVGSAMSLACRVIGKRKFKDLNQVYVSDSVYMSFLPALYGDYYLQMERFESPTIYNDQSSGKGLDPTCIYGMTCDGVDIIVKQWNLPPLEIGEWLLFHNQGAYTESIETNFNMLEHPTKYFRSSNPAELKAARDAYSKSSNRDKIKEEGKNGLPISDKIHPPEAVCRVFTLPKRSIGKLGYIEDL